MGSRKPVDRETWNGEKQITCEWNYRCIPPRWNERLSWDELPPQKLKENHNKIIEWELAIVRSRKGFLLNVAWDSKNSENRKGLGHNLHASGSENTTTDLSYDKGFAMACTRSRSYPNTNRWEVLLRNKTGRMLTCQTPRSLPACTLK